MNLPLLADTSTQTSSASALPLLFIFGLLAAVIIVAQWKIFEKAGESGWKAIVPVYNVLIFLKIVGRPMWWIVLFFIPFVNLVVSIITSLDLARVFGKSTVFGVFGLIVFSIVGLLILGFGDATYQPAEVRATSTSV